MAISISSFAIALVLTIVNIESGIIKDFENRWNWSVELVLVLDFVNNLSFVARISYYLRQICSGYICDHCGDNSRKISKSFFYDHQNKSCS